MQISSSNLRIFISCLMLFIFVVKLTTVVSGIFRFQKTSILITADNEDRSGDEKKNESKTAFNFNEFLNAFPASVTDCVAYSIICNPPHPEFLINFISTHYPAVLTPPPNC